MLPAGATTTPRLHKADLHMLAVFMTVAECGGFAAAQVALNVGQSTISRQIVARRADWTPIGAVIH